MGYDGHLKFNTKIDESGFNSGISKLGTIAKGGLAVLGSAVAGFTAVTKLAVDEVASLEQNIGGIETLFGTGGQTLEEYAKSVGKSTEKAKKKYEMLMEAQTLALDNANKAYKTAGLSANEYMSTVTSFAAALKQSVSNEVEAAKAADQAIIDMSDNANKMGTAMESIQNAYQGFAKQNYTMLDNLKLGYGGTKEEMQRLLADARKISGVKYDLNNLADVYAAIHVIQTELGITGTTAKEAATTIEGSMASAKAAWSNYLAGVGTADDLADAFGTAAQVLAKNLAQIVPRLVATLPEVAGGIYEGIVEAVEEADLAEIGLGILDDIMTGIKENGPKTIEAGVNMLADFVDGIAQSLPDMIPVAVDMIALFADTMVQNVPTIIKAGIGLIKGLLLGIINSLPTLISEGPRIINDFADAIYAGLFELIKAGAEILWALVQGIWQSVPLLLENAGEIFLMFINIFSLSKLFALGQSLINNLIGGISKLGPNMVKAGGNIVSSIVNGIKSLATHPIATFKNIALKIISSLKAINWGQIGHNIIQGIVNGLKSKASSIVTAAKTAVGAALSGVKNFLGIKSPSRRFRDEVGAMMAEGTGIGFEDNLPVDDMAGALDTSVQKMQKKVSTVTQDAGAQTAERVANTVVQGSTDGVDNGINVQVVNHVEVDGTPLVVKTTKATIKKLNETQKNTNKVKGKS